MELKGKLVVVIVGGKFGQRAVRFAKDSQAKVAVIDKNAKCRASKLVTSIVEDGAADQVLAMNEGESTLFVREGIDFLLRLIELSFPDYISPAMPGHLMGTIIQRWLEENSFTVEGERHVLDAILRRLPDNIVLDADREKSSIIVSYLPKELKCPALCPHPEKFCFITKGLKMGPMYQILDFATWEIADVSKIFMSHQLGPDAGAIEGSEVLDMLKHLGKLQPPYNMALGTACECHGILNTFRVT